MSFPPAQVAVEDLITLHFNLTNIKISDLSFDPSMKLATLLDNYSIVQFRNLSTHFKGRYEYVTDPPILADMGQFIWDINNISMKLGSRTIWDEENSQFDINIG